MVSAQRVLELKLVGVIYTAALFIDESIGFLSRYEIRNGSERSLYIGKQAGENVPQHGMNRPSSNCDS